MIYTYEPKWSHLASLSLDCCFVAENDSFTSEVLNCWFTVSTKLILFQWEELLSNPFFQLKFFVKDRKGYCCRSRWKTIDLSLFLSLWNTHKHTHTHTLTNSQTHTHAYKESSEKKRIGLFSVDKIFFNLGLFDHEKILLKVVRLKYYWSCWTRKPRSFLKWPSLKFKKYTAI